MMIRPIALSMIAIVAVAACNNDAEPTPDPALAFCDSAKSLASAVVSFGGLGGQDSIQDIQTSAEAVQAAFQAMRTSAGTLAESEVNAIEEAADEFRSAVEAVPDTDTVDQALASLAPQVAALREAINEAGDTNCRTVLIEEAASDAATAEATAAAEAAEAVGTAEAQAEASLEAAAGDAESAVESLLPGESPAA